MSMSTHVIGFKAPDETWQKHKAVWDACDAAGVSVPEETEEFFNYEPPDNRGVEVHLPLSEWSDNSRLGYEIEMAKLPEGLTHIRFYNAW